MATKVRAAAQVTELGIPCVITSGQNPGMLRRVLLGEEVGTLFCAQEIKHSARSAWIAHALFPKCRLFVDLGARAAILERKKSLLPAGILRVDGDFHEGDPVDLADTGDAVFARGLSSYGSEALRQIAGKKSAEIERILGYRLIEEAVHRDDLAILQ